MKDLLIIFMISISLKFSKSEDKFNFKSSEGFYYQKKIFSFFSNNYENISKEKNKNILKKKKE